MFHIANGTMEKTEGGFLLIGNAHTILLDAPDSKLFLLSKENNRNYVIPVPDKPDSWKGCDRIWILPREIESPEPAYCILAPGGEITVLRDRKTCSIRISSRRCQAIEHENRPRCDFFGEPYSFAIPNGDTLAKTLAAFYWDSILPMVKEKTSARTQRFSQGFVVSTLQKGAYAGSYPDVDHEFQIKGRLAMGGALELDVVRRMMEMQIDVMRRDPSGQWRNPCAIQPKGNREYHVPRDSWDLSQNAIMFLLTGNIEIIESAWHYVCKTKDTAWLEAHIEDFERATSLVERYIDDGGRLWSDVYYEDQVIKDGRETIAQAFAANTMQLLSRMERMLGREEPAEKYRSLSALLADTLVKPLPEGCWDERNGRFVDWVDRKGVAHDHIHLLANELPLLFGYATGDQAQKVRALLVQHGDVFWKFPSFVAARIEDYREDEIGTGGPYDLCAAGRYWCWDAEYWRAQGDRNMLRAQLDAVAAQAQADGYIMGERYDMNYVYYESDLNWHGAAHYYEYPNVFAWVLVHEYLGIRPQPDCDYLIAPRIAEFGSVRFGDVGYRADASEFQLTNQGGKPICLRLELSALYPGATVHTADGEVTEDRQITLQPGESVRLSVSR